MHIVSFGRSFLHDSLKKATIIFFGGEEQFCAAGEKQVWKPVCMYMCKIGPELLHLPLDGDVAENDSPA